MGVGVDDVVCSDVVVGVSVTVGDGSVSEAVVGDDPCGESSVASSPVVHPASASVPMLARTARWDRLKGIIGRSRWCGKCFLLIETRVLVTGAERVVTCRGRVTSLTDCRGQR